MRLITGSKNYSSWSVRPWILLTHKEIPFEETLLSFNDPEFKKKLAKESPAGRVPVLVDGELSVWDSLAIVEYLADKFPDKGIWPKAMADRARARSICAEMHAGFQMLRTNMPANIEARLPGRGWNVAVQKDIDRLTAIFNDALKKSGGPFLFGDFTGADAYFTPVAVRFRCYDIKLSEPAEGYMQRLLSTPAFKKLEAQVTKEKDFVDFDEPYRTSRG